MKVKITWDCFSRLMDIPTESRPVKGEQILLDGHVFDVKNVLSTPQLDSTMRESRYFMNIDVSLSSSEGDVNAMMRHVDWKALGWS